MKLYDFHASGNCHKVRMLLSFLGLAYESIPINVRRNESQTPEFLALNPRGQVPVLADGDTVLWDSQAILVYLARAYGQEWLPLDALSMARVMQWLALAQDEARPPAVPEVPTRPFQRPLPRHLLPRPHCIVYALI